VRGRGGVQSLERAAALLRALAEAGRPLSAGELAAAVGLPRPTVYRLLQTLCAEGWVAQNGRSFVIGASVLWLAARRLEQLELRSVGRPLLAELRDRTGETVHLGVLEAGQVVYVEKLESPGPLRMASWLRSGPAATPLTTWRTRKASGVWAPPSSTTGAGWRER
jgi:IclR family acetate operon transcriptional repressor